jgi:hypothetical protein
MAESMLVNANMAINITGRKKKREIRIMNGPSIMAGNFHFFKTDPTFLTSFKDDTWQECARYHPLFYSTIFN